MDSLQPLPPLRQLEMCLSIHEIIRRIAPSMSFNDMKNARVAHRIWMHPLEPFFISRRSPLVTFTNRHHITQYIKEVQEEYAHTHLALVFSFQYHLADRFIPWSNFREFMQKYGPAIINLYMNDHAYVLIDNLEDFNEFSQVVSNLQSVDDLCLRIALGSWASKVENNTFLPIITGVVPIPSIKPKTPTQNEDSEPLLRLWKLSLNISSSDQEQWQNISVEDAPLPLCKNIVDLAPNLKCLEVTTPFYSVYFSKENQSTFDFYTELYKHLNLNAGPNLSEMILCGTQIAADRLLLLNIPLTRLSIFYMQRCTPQMWKELASLLQKHSDTLKYLKVDSSFGISVELENEWELEASIPLIFRSPMESLKELDLGFQLGLVYGDARMFSGILVVNFESPKFDKYSEILPKLEMMTVHLKDRSEEHKLKFKAGLRQKLIVTLATLESFPSAVWYVMNSSNE